MTSYTGYKFDGNQLYAPSSYVNQRIFINGGWGYWWNNSWDVALTPRNTAKALDIISDGGTHTNNQPIGMRNASFTAHSAGGYGDIFYNRILIEPSTLAFGDLVSESTLGFSLWNAYFENKTATIAENDFDSGLEWTDETSPKTYLPLQEVDYTVTMSMSGYPTVEASIVWTFVGETVTLLITGSRVVLLPIIFRDDCTETVEFLTNVLNTYNGSEQRICARHAPRQSFSVSAGMNHIDMHTVKNLLYGWSHQTWMVPNSIERRHPTVSVIAGDTVINVSSLNADFRTGGMAVLWRSPSHYDVFGIESMTDNTITANREINYNFSTGDWVMPVLSMRMTSPPQRTVTGYNSVLSCNLECVDNELLDTSASAVQYNSTDTFFDEQLGNSTEDYQREIMVIDNNIGTPYFYSPWDYTKVGRTINFVLEGQDELWTFREWIHRRQGKLRPFYAPSWECDFNILSTGIIISSFEATYYSAQAFDRTNIVFHLTDGSWEIREITNIEVNLSGNIEVIFTPSLNVDVSLIDDVQYFGLKRLGTDTIEMKHLANNVTLVSLPILEITP